MDNIYILDFKNNKKTIKSETEFFNSYILSDYDIPDIGIWNDFVAQLNYNTNDDIYIICPMYTQTYASRKSRKLVPILYYNDNNDYIGDGSTTKRDFQISITGNMKDGETKHHAFNRELGEEVGLEISNFRALQQLPDLPPTKKQGIIYNSFIDIADTLYLTNDDNKYDSQEDINPRASIIVYGTFENIKRVYNNSLFPMRLFQKKNSYNQNEKDALTQVGIIKLKTIDTKLKEKFKIDVSPVKWRLSHSQPSSPSISYSSPSWRQQTSPISSPSSPSWRQQTSPILSPSSPSWRQQSLTPGFSPLLSPPSENWRRYDQKRRISDPILRRSRSRSRSPKKSLRRSRSKSPKRRR